MPRKKGTQADEAYAFLKDSILNLKVAPGEEISSFRLERILNMSRSPIREAILQLQADGLIEVCDGKTVASQIQFKDVKEICQVRKAIEILAIELLFQKGGPSEAMLDSLIAIIDKMREADVQEHYKLDDQFHDILLAASGNSRIIEISDKMRMQLSRVRWLNIILVPRRLETSTKEHEDVYVALKNGDCKKACEAMVRHLDVGEEGFKMVLQDSGEKRELLKGIITMLDSYT